MSEPQAHRAEATDAVIALIARVAETHGPYTPMEVAILVLGILEEIANEAPEHDWQRLMLYIKFAMSLREAEGSHGRVRGPDHS